MSAEPGSRPTVAARAAKHAALSDPGRLAVVDQLLVGDASPSELQTHLEMSSNLLAHHLKVLQDAGVVHRRRSEGDRRRSYLGLVPGGLDVIGAEAVGAPKLLDARGRPPRRLVFVCTANSARSQLATALWRDCSDLPASSAGTQPADRIAPGARAAARRHGLRLVDDAPRHLDDVLDDGDLVVTVCDHAHEGLAGRDTMHWAIADPVAVGTAAAYDGVVAELGRRISTLAGVTDAVAP